MPEKNPLKTRKPTGQKSEKKSVDEVVSKLHGKDANGVQKTSMVFDKDLYVKMKIRLAYSGKSQRDYIEELIRADLEANNLL